LGLAAGIEENRNLGWCREYAISMLDIGSAFQRRGLFLRFG